MRRIVCLLALLAFAACKKEVPAPSPAAAAPPAPPPAEAYSEKLLDDVAQIATGHPLDPAVRTETLAALRAGTKTVDAFLEELVKTDDFARIVVPRVLLGEFDFGPVTFTMWNLRPTTVDGQTVYSYRKPCALADSVEVAPWWDASTKIRICKADYQPTTMTTTDGRACSAYTAREAPECGCGPQLINCLRDDKHYREISNSLYGETTGTIAQIVSHDQPFKDVFTTTYSWRDRNTEYMRMRDMLYAGKVSSIPDLAKWPADPVWAPRTEYWPGSQAGILTTKQYLYMSCGPRDRMRQIFARTWCTTPGSFGVTSDQFSKLVAEHTDIRFIGTGWEQLAAAPGCSECHARMDYGMQFFAGYPAVTKALTPVPAQSHNRERGPIYLRDIDDPRGESSLTPHALGELIVSQPEFGQCMSQLVGDHVLGKSASEEERTELAATFKSTGTMRALFLDALRLYVRRAAQPHSVEVPPVPTVASRPAADAVTVPPRLAARLAESCADCHDDGEHAFMKDFAATKTLPRAVMISAANFIAADLMPKNGTLAQDAKLEMLDDLVAALAPDQSWAQNAHDYWLGGLTGSRVHHIGAVRERIARASAYTLTPDDKNHKVEDLLEGELTTMTPALVSSVGQLAVATCRPLKTNIDAYRACLRNALRPESLLVK